MELTPIGENFDLMDLPLENPNEIHLMNLKDLFGETIDANVSTFESIFRPLYNQGYLLYHREIVGPIGSKVQVRDAMTGNINTMLMFGSNNYLGFANDDRIRSQVKKYLDEYGIGMAGPMILNGHGSLQREVEKRLARFKGCESAVLLPTGYQANLAWINSLITDQAVLLYDEASHASVIDGVRLGRKKAFRFSNTDLSTLQLLLEKYRKDDPLRDIWVCVQGVYSMTGETADLPFIAELCDIYRAYLVIDDAHGTGVLGNGRGSSEHFQISDKVKLTMGTFSKSFAVTGGFLAGESKLINFIRFFARPYFFTAAASPLICGAVLAGLDIIEENNQRVQTLHNRANTLKHLLKEASINFKWTDSAIIPVFPPRKGVFRQLALELHKLGLFINPIEPPAVPVGDERFRMSVMATHTDSEISEAVQILKRVFSRYA